MIKVIKYGYVPTYEIKCPECDSILHFIYKDENMGFKKYESMIYGEWDHYCIICPVCRHEIITREKDNEIINDYRKLVEE